MPAEYTPHIRTGVDISETVVIGDTAFIAGEFTKIENAKRTRAFTRHNFAAYSVTTGKVSPLRVDFDAPVSAMEASPSGDFLYIGGAFTHVGNVHAPFLVKVRVSDGALVEAFDWPGSLVKDVQFSHGRLFVAGKFARALVAIRPKTGEFTPYIDLSITESLSGAAPRVEKIAISPNGRSLIAIGDFTVVNGESRSSAFRLGLRDRQTRLKDWHPQRFNVACIPRVPFYLRDVAWSPDGSYFVIVSSGGPGGGYPVTGFCDGAGRWEASSAGSVAEPTWVNWTGGDSLYSVAVGADADLRGRSPALAGQPHGPRLRGAGRVRGRQHRRHRSRHRIRRPRLERDADDPQPRQGEPHPLRRRSAGRRRRPHHRRRVPPRDGDLPLLSRRARRLPTLATCTPRVPARSDAARSCSALPRGR